VKFQAKAIVPFEIVPKEKFPSISKKYDERSTSTFPIVMFAPARTHSGDARPDIVRFPAEKEVLELVMPALAKSKSGRSSNEIELGRWM